MNRLFLSLVVGIVTISVLLILQATRSNASTVLTVTELIHRARNGSMPRVRMGARVGDEEIIYKLQPASLLQFTVHDRNAPEKEIPVRFEGLKPDLFQSGRDVLIDGDYINGVFVATKLLTQCPSKYEPPPPGKK